MALNGHINASDMFLEGHEVKDRFQIIKKIGEGAFAQVFRCIDKKTQKTAAIKVSKENFKLETEILKSINGKNYFPTFSDSGKSDDLYYIVMELQGENLKNFIRKLPDMKLSLGSTLRIGSMMLQGLEYLHTSRIVHRDIKPSNICLCPHNPKKVCLVDFGLSKYLTTKGRPKVNGVTGTLRYASINVLELKDQGRNDDLIALFYSMVELVGESFPWKKFKEVKEVLEAKKCCDHVKLVKQFPPRFQGFYRMISTLKYEDRPNYVALNNILDKCIQERGIKESDTFEWEDNSCIRRTRFASIRASRINTSYGVESKLSSSTCEDRDLVQKKIQYESNLATDVLNYSFANNHKRICKLNTSCSSSDSFPSQNLSSHGGKKGSEFRKSISSINSRDSKLDSYSKILHSKGNRKLNILCKSNSFDVSNLMNQNKKSQKVLISSNNENQSKLVRSHSANKKRRRPVRRSVSHPAKLPTAIIKRTKSNINLGFSFLNIITMGESLPQGIPRCWSCPAISLCIRSELKPPLRQQASFDEQIYDVDVMRNIAAKHIPELDCTFKSGRRLSLPSISSGFFSDAESPTQASKGCPDFQAYHFGVHNKKPRHTIKRTVSTPAKIPPSALSGCKYLNVSGMLASEQDFIGVPRCWSCPTISLYIRSDLKPPFKQQASFDEDVYEVDVIRNVAAKRLFQCESDHEHGRRYSLPSISSDTNMERRDSDSNDGFENVAIELNISSKSEVKDIIDETTIKPKFTKNVTSDIFTNTQSQKKCIDIIKNGYSENLNKSKILEENFSIPDCNDAVGSISSKTLNKFSGRLEDRLKSLNDYSNSLNRGSRLIKNSSRLLNNFLEPINNSLKPLNNSLKYLNSICFTELKANDKSIDLTLTDKDDKLSQNKNKTKTNNFVNSTHNNVYDYDRQVQETSSENIRRNGMKSELVQRKEIRSTETQSKEKKSKEIQIKEIQRKEIQSKEAQSKEIKSKKIQNEEIQSKEMQNKNKQNKEVNCKEIKTEEKQIKEIQIEKLQNNAKLSETLQSTRLQSKELQSKIIQNKEMERKQMQSNYKDTNGVERKQEESKKLVDNEIQSKKFNSKKEIKSKNAMDSDTKIQTMSSKETQNKNIQNKGIENKNLKTKTIKNEKESNKEEHYKDIKNKLDQIDANEILNGLILNEEEQSETVQCKAIQNIELLQCTKLLQCTELLHCTESLQCIEDQRREAQNESVQNTQIELKEERYPKVYNNRSKQNDKAKNKDINFEDQNIETSEINNVHSENVQMKEKAIDKFVKEDTNTTTVTNDSPNPVIRRHRLNASNKYVENENEHNLTFTRKRHRLSGIFEQPLKENELQPVKSEGIVYDKRNRYSWNCSSKTDNFISMYSPLILSHEKDTGDGLKSKCMNLTHFESVLNRCLSHR